MTEALTSPSRRELRKVEVRERILEAAVQLFVDQGCETTSVEQICERAELSRMTFYNYFSSKQQVIYALSESELFGRAGEYMEEARQRFTATLDRLRHYIHLSLDGISNSAPLERELLWQVQTDRDPKLSAQRFFQMQDLLARLIAEGQQRGEITHAYDQELLASMIFGSMSAATQEWLHNPDFAIAARAVEICRFVTDMLEVGNC